MTNLVRKVGGFDRILILLLLIVFPFLNLCSKMPSRCRVRQSRVGKCGRQGYGLGRDAPVEDGVSCQGEAQSENQGAGTKQNIETPNAQNLFAKNFIATLVVKNLLNPALRVTMNNQAMKAIREFCCMDPSKFNREGDNFRQSLAC